jgi:psp operon transcriptional activator
MSSTMEAIGQAEAFLAFQDRLSRVARVDRAVLLIGERGTGKELAARRLHYLSTRWQGPLVALNCAALASTLIEPELFGYEKGAFTGAQTRRLGRFESAHGGTLFLDEIGAIPLEVQEKILRVVEYATFERVGSTRAVDVDVRIVGATNADLPELTRQGRFKQDLLDRLSFDVLFLPPLRERRSDIMLLAEHFAQRMAVELARKELPRFSAAAIGELEAYPWPGNIRELKNVVERAVYRAESAIIKRIEFDPFRSPYHTVLPAGVEYHARPSAAHQANREVAANDLSPRPLKEAVAQLEIRMLRCALNATRYNRRQAAQYLGVTYDQLRGLMRKHNGALDE